MTQTLDGTELLKQINTNILKLRTPVIVLYLLIMFILRIVGIACFPNQVFAILSFMLLTSLILVWFFNNSSLAPQTIVNSFFAYNLFDLALLTWVMYYFGGLLWTNFIFYSFIYF